jgi:hypothetical protein
MGPSRDVSRHLWMALVGVCLSLAAPAVSVLSVEARAALLEYLKTL